ncbi:type II secretion system minor pseudopilin GspI [Chromatiaceae bacterium AAb-1]|nr:type II secretion system minor pseudopilin GspI [Chromatiaceae bacterium AAb-1]
MNARGFTLLELLVAMAIFATAGLAIMQTSAAHLRALTQLEELTLASYIADNELQKVLLKRDSWPPKEKMQGQLEMANRHWLWQIQISKIADDDLRLVQINVSQAEQPNEVLYQLQTYIGKHDG